MPLGLPLKCIACNPSCLTCTGTISNCLSCASPTFLQTNTCLSICPDYRYGNVNTSTCQSCSTGCRQCNSGLSTECTACGVAFDFIENYNVTYYLSAGKCLTACPSGEFIDGSNLCGNCSQYCQVCKNATYCTFCISAFLTPDMLCSTACPDNYFGNVQNSVC